MYRWITSTFATACYMRGTNRLAFPAKSSSLHLVDEDFVWFCVISISSSN